MLGRRDLLSGAGLAALVPAMPALCDPVPRGASSEVDRLNALFAKFAQEKLLLHPEFATSLGLDKGDLAPLKSRLTDMSLAAMAKETENNARQIKALKGIDRSRLHGIDAANYDTVLFTAEIEDEGNRSFDYGGGDSGAPYILSQLTGAYQSVPDFLVNQHKIEAKDDADAYLARMGALAEAMDQELEQARHDVGRGVVPPDFVIDKALIQMKTFLGTPADGSPMVQAITRQAKDKNLAGDYAVQAEEVYTGKIVPALGRQADFLKELRPKSVHDAGVGRLPKGADYYRVSLKKYTTSTLSPAEIHKTGIDLVARISADLDAKLTAQGLPGKSVGARLAALTADPKYLYENTDVAKEKLIADLNLKVAAVEAKLPDYFGALPKARVEIRRVPKAIEAGAPGGYYQPGSLDGARPGAYYINLRDTAELPSWGLSTLTFHESIPGHHLQGTLANETTGLPLLRKMIWFSGYGEGWALYAEQLAVEMGMYDGDPLGHIGQLQAALFRAVRLVVDSGMHAMGWSRERAAAYYIETLGERESAAVTEIERYCVWPGQACSYMVGKLTWLRLRDRARKALGAGFDIHKFHDAGLLSGALPLAVLDRVIDQYVSDARG